MATVIKSAEEAGTVRYQQPTPSTVVQTTGYQPVNTGQVVNTVPTEEGPTNSASFLTNVTISKENIEKETDPTEKLRLIADLNKSMLVRKTERTQKIAEDITSASGILQLEKDFKATTESGFFSGNTVVNVLKRKAGIESTEQSQRRAIQTMRQSNQQNLINQIATDPDLAAIDADFDPQTGYFTMQVKEADRQQGISDQQILHKQQVADRRTLNAENRKLTLINAQTGRLAQDQITDANREAANLVIDDRKTADLLRTQELAEASTSPNQLALFSASTGKPNTEISALAHHKKMTSDPDYKLASMNADSPGNLLKLSLGVGDKNGRENPYAKKYLIQKQAELVAGTTDKNSTAYQNALNYANRSHRFMMDVVTKPTKRDAAMRLVYGSPESAPAKAWKDRIDTSTYGQTKAEAERTRVDFYSQLAEDAHVQIEQDAFVADLSSWGDASFAKIQGSSMYKEIRKEKGEGAPIGMQDMVNAIVKIEDPATRKGYLAEFTALAETSANERTRKSFFGVAMNAVTLQNMIAKAVTRTVFGIPLGAGDIGDNIYDFATGEER